MRKVEAYEQSQNSKGATIGLEQKAKSWTIAQELKKQNPSAQKTYDAKFVRSVYNQSTDRRTPWHIFKHI